MKLLLAVLFVLIVCTSAVPQGTRIVAAAEANGTYRYRHNEIKILALGHNKLRIQMNLTYEYKTSSGPMANVGEASGDRTINCGFGMNVSSEGIYTKTKSGKPKFDSDN